MKRLLIVVCVIVSIVLFPLWVAGFLSNVLSGVFRQGWRDADKAGDWLERKID